MTRLTADHVMKLMNDRAIQKEKAFKDLPHGAIITMSVGKFDEFRDWIDEHHDDEGGTTRFKNAGYDHSNGIKMKAELRSDCLNTVMIAKMTFGGM